MTTAFVLSGGGSLGSVQAGMLLALSEHGITPDLVVGAPVGAINAAWIAGHPDRAGALTLAGIQRSVGREQVYPARAGARVDVRLARAPKPFEGSGGALRDPRPHGVRLRRST